MILTVVDSRAVGPQIADHLTGIHLESNVRDGGNTAIAFGQVLELKHGGETSIAISYVAYYF
jgi:hypothetical protein